MTIRRVRVREILFAVKYLQLEKMNITTSSGIRNLKQHVWKIFVL
jgi:hypothetical protein